MRPKDLLRRLGRPIVRQYLLHSPLHAGKRAFWSRIGHHFAWPADDFLSRTPAGFEFGGNTGDLIDRALYFSGRWEPELTGYVERTLQVGDTFVDVGANIGYFSWLASGLVGDQGRVVAIEASPRIFQILERHLDQNGCSNVRRVNVGASDQAGELRLIDGPLGNRGHTHLVAAQAGDPGSSVSVRVDRMDQLLSSAEIENTRLIKIDVEGLEAEVVRGLDGVLSRGRRELELVVEITPDWSDSASAVEEIFARLAGFGFVPYILASGSEVEACIGVPRFGPPRRLRGRLEARADVLFSRTDRETL